MYGVANLRKKNIYIIILFLFFLSTLQTNSVALKVRKNDIVNEITDIEIFLDINNTEEKILLFDDKIGDVHVRYWEHFKDDVWIKNDSILLHLGIEDGEILKYRKSWTNTNELFIDYNDCEFQLAHYAKKQLVVFPDESDIGLFYTFDNPQVYPLTCWEIWFDNGETILYNQFGEKIGYGIPTPSSGFSLSGYEYSVSSLVLPEPDNIPISEKFLPSKLFSIIKWLLSLRTISRVESSFQLLIQNLLLETRKLTISSQEIYCGVQKAYL